MNDWLETVADALGSALVAASTALIIYIGARRLGLTPLQVAAKNEQSRLLDAIKDRLSILERERTDLERKLASLQQDHDRVKAENEELKRRIDDLERIIADDLLKRRRASSTPR